MKIPVVEVKVTINGEDVFGLLAGGGCLAPSEDERGLVVAALAEALVSLTGTRPIDPASLSIRVTRRNPAPILSMVRGSKD